MARTLVIIRHAKAEHVEGRDDHGRALAGQGRRDAPVIGRWLSSQDVSVQVAVVSSARRTQETYRLLAAELPGAPDPVVTDDVYYASAGDLLEIVRALPPEATSAAIVGHNPGIGMLANALDDGASAVEGTERMRAGFPTSSVAVFSVDGDWATIDPGGARLVGYTVARG
ncbi:SixA phosphatase family protein [Jiangella rhizosphaerae]|uniref:Histidine phosphatase family protein n=1 Tax=Jiangella rhizosphaerae TaxID=2293569 RepID=A0A418KTL6_9ACTN|nr:histidine phosphatase family protein [Jiangella rhizosphaerae]RIQ30193.1 histidine phosphatase family protein [Jiangella rhizosphaerae]